ncbi:antizyme inhibitor 2 isoform X2 [Elgaria multicarinata webbii]|uniref:antizyme inhibitor 2 isoform X2 n=1 Tax=Elgaria multicarinata webbii TaxID=159646 RepID=UPI002FCD266E
MTRYLDESDIMMVEEGFTTRDLLENLLLEVAQTGNREPFFVADLDDVVKKHFRLLKALPRIKPFYALKCNHSKGVLQMLAGLGAGFGCVNKAEMATVKSIGVPPDRIICTSPCKQNSLIRYAASQGVQLMTFDNEVELEKAARSHPSARMIVCLATDDSRSSTRLSMKFGASLKTCRHLLETAKEINVEVVGISFHIGSSCTDPRIFTQSIADARLVFEMGAELGYKMHLLDIGGVFPGPDESRGRFEEKPSPDLPVHNSSFWGPTGDGLDRIADGLELPELHVGDWLIFENMGAHTVPACSSLSGAQQAQIHYAMSRMAWEAVQFLKGKLLHPEEEDRESTCAPLSCGWEITDTLCVAPVFAPASIM